MPPRLEQGSQDEDTPPQPRDDAYMGRVEHFMPEMIEALQCITGANATPVHEYEAEFMRLSQYAPKLVAHEASRCKRFRFGLNRDIKLYLVVQSTEVFDELVEKACALEETLREEPKVVAIGTAKRSSESASGFGQKGKRGHFRKFG
ncbi:hypothetical protein V6Z11_D07G164700 [Gossypium hirsutum]